jgi:hypothetical protein
MNSFFRKLLWLTQRRDKRAELRMELQFRLEEVAEERQEHGVAKDEARWAARREFGNVSLVEEAARDEWGWTRLEQLVRDAVSGLRQIRRNPGFSAITIATLALGIGANSAIFSIVEAVLLRPLALKDPGRLAMLFSGDPARAQDLDAAITCVIALRKAFPGEYLVVIPATGRRILFTAKRGMK